MSGVKLVVYGGILVMVVAGSVVSGIIAAVISEGDDHKEHMVTSPPPPSPPARRMMTEHEELYGKAGNSHFDLTHDERKIFHKLAAAAPIFKSATKSPVYIGTSANELVLSVHLEPDEEGEDQRPKKRRRSSNYQAEVDDSRNLAEARTRLEKSVPELQSHELDVAQKVLTKLAKDLRGPAGEVVVQSTAMLARKLGSNDSRQRVVVAARLNAGIAIRVDALRSCMGACWADGLFTTLPTLHGIGKIELPLSEEAHAALAFGNATLLLVTSVAIK